MINAQYISRPENGINNVGKCHSVENWAKKLFHGIAASEPFHLGKPP